MNTRIQVEHTVSEMIAGIDLIREQIRVAAGEPLGYGQDAIVFRGHAIEGRVNAEDPARNFAPAPGIVREYGEPAGPGVRIDSAAYPGFTVTPDYDSMIAKLVVWAPDRSQAIARFRRAIDEYAITGVPTTLPLLRALCDYAPVTDASYGTATLEAFAASHFTTDGETPRSHPEVSRSHPEVSKNPELVEGGTPQTIRVEVNDKLYRVRLIDLPASASRGAAPAKRPPKMQANARARTAAGNDVVAPMHGVVVEISAQSGAGVSEGQVVAVVEAMKMMNEIRAHKSGTVSTVHVKAGDTVEANAPLLTIQ